MPSLNKANSNPTLLLVPVVTVRRDALLPSALVDESVETNVFVASDAVDMF
jgi:hypothetical protein